MIYTGVDGNKTFSVDYSIIKKVWKPAKKTGRKIYVIPSDKCFVKKEKYEFKSKNELRDYLKIELEEYENILWDFSVYGEYYYLVLVRDFDIPEDYYAFDCEIFSLARLSRILNKPNLIVLDIGRRKTTVIETNNYELSKYRVILKGSNYISEKVSESVLINEGLENEKVKRIFQEILEETGFKFENKTVLLSGGGAKLKGMEKIFKNVIRNPYVNPELNSAFSASLKYVYKDFYPDFRKEGISTKERKALGGLIIVSSLVFFLSIYGLDILKKEILKEFSLKKKELFSQKFPELPAVAVEEQLRSFNQSKRSVLELIEKAFENLPEGVKIYRIEFKRNSLRLIGEGRKEDIEKINPDKIRKTPEGNYEFEVIVKW